MSELPSVMVKDLLVLKGYKWNIQPLEDWQVFIGKQSISLNRCIAIYDVGGLAPNPRWLLDEPSLQVKVRGNPNDYSTAWQKSKEVSDIILGVPSYTTTGGTRVNHINAIGDVAFTGWDDSERPEFTFNFRMIIEPPTNANTNRQPL
jgi:hypothetical protein